MRELKYGERVAIYGYDDCDGQWDGDTGMVEELNRNGADTISILTDDARLVTVHRRQCVPLKPKRKRREVWIHEDKAKTHTESMAGIPGWIHFIEVIKKK